MHDILYDFDPFSPIRAATHYLNRKSSSTLGWTEGWAQFFPLAVQDDKYKDYGQSNILPIDMEVKTWNQSSWDDGDQVEGRVAGALWDIYDTDNEVFDACDDGFDDIWNAFLYTEAETFAEFWDDLKNEVSDEDLAVRAILQNTIDYDDLMVADTDFHQGEDAGDYIFVSVNITSIEADSIELPGVDIRSYEAEMDYSSSGIEIKRVEGGDGPYDDPDVSIGASTTTFEQSVTGDVTTPLVARVYPVLTGSCLVPEYLDLDFTTIESDSNSNISDGDGYSQTYRRGDAIDDGVLTVGDALRIARYKAGLESPESINLLNAASVLHNHNENGDMVTVGDALAIAQCKVGLRDEYFNFLTKSKYPVKSDIADNVTVEVPSTVLSCNGSVTVPLMVKGIPVGSDGMGAYDVVLNYDPEVIIIETVLPGSGNYTGELVFSVNNTSGNGIFVGYDTSFPGASGNVTIANIQFKAVGDPGDSSNITLSINELISCYCDTINATSINGTVTLFPLDAETSMTQEVDVADNVIVVPVNIDTVKNGFTGENMTGILIDSYSANVTYKYDPPDGMEILAVRSGDSPFSNPSVNITNNSSGDDWTVFSQDTVNGMAPGITVARLVPRLIGCCLDTCNLILQFDSILSSDNETITQESSVAFSYMRGDANGDGTVNATDATAISWYRARLISLDDIVALNAASVINDGANGNVISIGDALRISQYVYGLRDCYFNWIGKSRESFSRVPDDVVSIETGKPELTDEKYYVVPLVVSGIPEDSAGLGGYVIRVGYDTETMTLVDVLPGKEGFTDKPVYNDQAGKGSVIIVGIHTADVKTVGDVTVAYLIVKYDGKDMEKQEFTVTADELVDSLGNIIPIKDNLIKETRNNL